MSAKKYPKVIMRNGKGVRVNNLSSALIMDLINPKYQRVYKKLPNYDRVQEALHEVAKRRKLIP